MDRYYDDIGCSKKLRKIAKDNGFEITKKTRNRQGYCIVYSLVNKEREIEIGTYSAVNRKYKRDEKELIDEILNGPVDYIAEYNDLMRSIAK